MKLPRLRLSKPRLDKLSDICSDVALVALASVVLPAVFDRYDPLRVALGLFVTFLFWILSVLLRK